MSDQIFISYSKKDGNFANKLADDLLKLGYEVWIDRSIGGGERWRASIEANLKASKEVIIIVSPNSMASDWVRHEGSLAYGWGKKLFPVLMESVTSLPPWLEEYQWISFINVPYESAFKALVAALTPTNPVQNLLDERVKVYQQTGELFGEETIDIIEKARDHIVISPEAEGILERSRHAIEIRQQRENEQSTALREAERKQSVIRKKGRRTVLLLLISFVAAACIFLLSFFPQPTGWRRLKSLDLVTSTEKTGRTYIVTVDDQKPEAIYISDGTPGGFYKAEFNKTACWKKMEVIPNSNMKVTSIDASDNHVYIIASGKLFSSTDGGRNWSPLPVETDQAAFTPVVLTVNPNDTQQIYVGTAPAGLFTYDGERKQWQTLDIPVADGPAIQAMDHNGTALVIAVGQQIWTRSGMSPDWKPVLALDTPAHGLSMVGRNGRFFVAGGEKGILDSDISSNTWNVLADSPPASFIQSVSTAADARYAATQDEVWYWRLFRWTDLNWFRIQFHQPIPCYE